MFHQLSKEGTLPSATVESSFMKKKKLSLLKKQLLILNIKLLKAWLKADNLLPMTETRL